MFLALREIKHEKVRYGLIVAMIVMISYDISSPFSPVALRCAPPAGTAPAGRGAATGAASAPR